MLSQAEVDWLNAYHAEVRNIVRAQLDESDKLWLDVATAPLN
jgi:Xaa-Pro aminopeptidase